MLLVNASMIGLGVLAGIGIGFAYGSSSRGRNQPQETQSDLPQTVADAPPTIGEEMAKLIVAVQRLTSDIDSQVGEHTDRVGQVTNSLTTPKTLDPAAIVAAGNLLVQVNEKLQTDLQNTKAELQKQREQVNSYLKDSLTDTLTNLPNRRAFDRELDEAILEYHRSKNPFCLLMLDVDHFKRINDLHGHMVGDQALKFVAQRLAGTIRENDFLARFGGEEFALILPRTRTEAAFPIAENIRLAISSTSFSIGTIALQITASIGVKEIARDVTGPALISQADKSLYSAKKDGRNRVS